ncbi:MAG: hypothetical protein P1V51_03230 [Deltaproteobacteria bacterium]|nr:hypothetical protein [Deltaproteobacteria bacterium]
MNRPGDNAPALSIHVLRLIIFLSGALALGYEAIWFRMLSHTVGSALLASTAVTAMFMLGSAVGSVAGGYGWLSTYPRPLRLYGALEGLVALLCLVLPLYLFVAQGLGVFLPTIAATLVTTLYLTIPSFVMGATFPVFVRAATLAGGLKNPAGFVYLWNLLGAAVGVLLGGMLIVPLLGIWAGMVLVVAAGLGVAAFAATRRLEGSTEEPQTPKKSGKKGRKRRTEVELLLPWGELAVAIFVFATCSLAVEIVGIRLVFMTGGTTTPYFTGLLFSFIGLTALGTALSRKISASASDRRIRQILSLGPALLGAGVAVMLLLHPVVLHLYASWLRPTATMAEYFASSILFSSMLLAVPCLAMGLYLPLVMGYLRREEPGDRSAGWMYGVYGLGNALGAVVAGVVLIPALGLYGTQLFLIVVCIVLTLHLALRVVPRQGGRLAGLGAAALLVAFLTLHTPWPELLPHVGSFIAPPNASSAGRRDFLEGRFENLKPLYSREGAMANVAAFEEPTPNGPRRYMMINGKVDAGSGTDQASQVLVGLIPMLYVDEPVGRAMVLGLGSGMTAAAIRSAGAARIEIVELLPEVVEAAQASFGEYVDGLFEAPEVKITIEDGLYRFATEALRSPGGYTVVNQQPTNLWVRGTGALFSRGHFENMRHLLEPGGVAAVWLGTYNADERLFWDVLRTLRAVFPHIEVYETIPGDVLFVAGTSPLSVTPERLDRLFAPGKVEVLHRAGIRSREGLLSLRILSQEEVDPRLEENPGVVFGAARPLAEWRTLRTFLAGQGTVIEEGREERWKRPEFVEWIARNTGREELDEDAYRAILMDQISHNGAHPGRTLRLADHMIEQDPVHVMDLVAAAAQLEARRYDSRALALLEMAAVHEERVRSPIMRRYLNCELLRVLMKKRDMLGLHGVPEVQARIDLLSRKVDVNARTFREVECF